MRIDDDDDEDEAESVEGGRLRGGAAWVYWQSHVLLTVSRSVARC